MPRTTYAHEGQEAPEAAPVYQNLKKGFGMVPNVVKLVGHSGPVTQAFGVLLDVYFNKLSLTPRVREIAYLTVARANECAYCQGHHVPMGKAAGLSDEHISLLGPQGFDNPAFNEAERAVIRFAYQTTQAVKAEDEAVEALKRNFSPKEIAELAFVAAAGNFIQRIGKNLGAELEFAPAAKG